MDDDRRVENTFRMEDDGRAEDMHDLLVGRVERRRQEADAVEIERRARVTGVGVPADRTPTGVVIGNG